MSPPGLVTAPAPPARPSQPLQLMVTGQSCPIRPDPLKPPRDGFGGLEFLPLPVWDPWSPAPEPRALCLASAPQPLVTRLNTERHRDTFEGGHRRGTYELLPPATVRGTGHRAGCRALNLALGNDSSPRHRLRPQAPTSGRTLAQGSDPSSEHLPQSPSPTPSPGR